MVTSSLEQQTTGCTLPHDWLVRLTIDLADFVIYGAENSINWCQIAAIWLCLIFARHFVATHPPATLQPYRSACGTG